MHATSWPHAGGPSLTRFSLWLSLPQLITWGSVFYTFSLLVPPLEAAWGMDRSSSALAFSLCLLAEGASAWLVGRWIDHGHERRVMALGSLWVGVGLWAHSLVDSVAGFYACWIWIGLGLSATLYAPAFALVTRRFGSDFRRAILILSFLGGLASTVFIPLSHLLIEQLGWRDALRVLALLQWGVCLPLHAWLLRGAPPRRTHGSDGAPVRLGVHLRRWPFWLLAAYTLLMMGITSALPAHMIVLLQERGLSPHWVVWVPAAIGAVQVMGRLVLFVFERHWDVHTSNRWIPVLVPLGLIALLVSGQALWGALLFALFYGLGNGMNTIVKGTAMAQYVSREHVGQLNGLLGVPQALARAGAPLLLGLLWSPTGGYTLGLWVMLLLGLVGTAALWGAQWTARQRRP